MPAPVILFVYNRPEHTARTVEALRANLMAQDTELFVYADGPKNEAVREKVEAVREYVRKITGFKAVTVIERAQNIGLAQSVISGVTEVIKRYGRVIVVEDDLVTSPYFLNYMNDGLDLYVDDDRVASIHGYIYPVMGELPESFFLRGADCWGWATWARAWRLFEPDSARLRAEINARGLRKAFDMDGAFRYNRLLRLQAAGKIDSWAIRWYASAFLKGKFTLYPGKTFVKNIGTDGTGTHYDDTTRFESEFVLTYAGLKRQPVEDCEQAKRLIYEFSRKTQRHPLVLLFLVAMKKMIRLTSIR